MSGRDYKGEFIDYLKDIKQKGFNIKLVESGKYSYFVYIPEKPQTHIMMDCLNDYEDEMNAGETENLEGIEEVYRNIKKVDQLQGFKGLELIRKESDASRVENEENKDKTTKRLYTRMTKGMDALTQMIGRNEDIPVIIPLIPGYKNEPLNGVASQLDKDVISKVAPEIKTMIEDAKKIIEEETGVKMADKIIPLGHSKSATFASNFSAYYPEMCEASILGGGSFGTLPIDKINLEVVKEITKNSPPFTRDENGVVTKQITQNELDRIVKEYNESKRDDQDDIVLLNEKNDGKKIYSLPLNFPLGIADIKHYRDLTNYPGGKEGYREALTKVSKMIFLGEHEDAKPGHFAYKDVDDKIVAGTDLGENIEGVEAASMHNRVLEYVATSNSIFGRSTNERLGSYMELNELLHIPMQSKIYKGVGHTNYDGPVDNEKNGKGPKVHSKGIYEKKAVGKDIVFFYKGVCNGNIPNLDNKGRANRINPVYQLLRRYVESRRRY